MKYLVSNFRKVVLHYILAASPKEAESDNVFWGLEGIFTGRT
jgi:hypothetical protein